MSTNDDIDFFRDASVVADPYPYFESLRAGCPVQREPHHDVVMVTGYDESIEVFHDTATFSSCTSVTGPFPGFPVPLVGDDVTALIEEYRDQLPFSDQLPTFDPPKHTAHRALLMRLITPKRLKENEAFMWRLADRQIDEFIANGECDLVHDFAQPFAMLVIADLLGVPEGDHEVFKTRLAPTRHQTGAVGSTSDETLTHSPLEFLYEQFTKYIEDRRRSPRNDVMTGLATATFPDGSTPEVIDVVRIASNLFAAGQETTVRLLGAAFQLIGERPDLQRMLRDDRARIPQFVEETLRIESPIKGDFRLARGPTSIGGVDIAAGTTVMVLNGAANRDPRRFEDPDQFQIDRVNARQQIAFGHGIHTCPGAPLARAEARVSIERLLDRTTDIRISEAQHGPAGQRRYEYVPTFILRGLRRLHIEFDVRETDNTMSDVQRITDLVDIHALCSCYMAYTSQFVDDGWLDVFTPDAEYNAFGTAYTLERFPALLAAAPRGQFIGNMPVVELDGDQATGIQHFVFIDQQTHAMRLGWYRDEYRRTKDGWRIHRRATTFMRKHGGFDSGHAHDPLAEN